MRDDEKIAEVIANQFKWSTLVPHDSLKIKVSNGWVTLSGRTEWEYQRKAALDLVNGLTGVKFVTNNIELKPKVEPSGLKEKIKAALARAAEHESKQIEVSVDGSRVILNGAVRSYAELRAIEGVVWGAPGVTDVKDNLRVSV